MDPYVVIISKRLSLHHRDSRDWRDTWYDPFMKSIRFGGTQVRRNDFNWLGVLCAVLTRNVIAVEFPWEASSFIFEALSHYSVPSQSHGFVPFAFDQVLAPSLATFRQRR